MPNLRADEVLLQWKNSRHAASRPTVDFASTLILLRALSTTCLTSCCVVEIVLMHVMGMMTALLGAKPLHESKTLKKNDGSFISTGALSIEPDRLV